MMGRVIWDDDKKSYRVSGAATELLARMASDGIPIRYEFRAGRYMRIVNGISQTVQERTVDALTRAGFISRVNKDEIPTYAANERAREFLKRKEANQKTEGGAMIDLSTMTDDEISRLSHSEARRAATLKAAGQLTAEESKQINAIHAERARRYSAQAARERAERATARENLNPRSTQPEIKTEQRVATVLSDGEAATAEIERIKEHRGGKPLITMFSAAEHEERMNHVLKVASQSTKGESISKPEPPVTLIAEKARDYQKQQHAKGNRFYSIAEAVNHVRQEMGLSNDTLATDADMTRRANAQD